MTQRNLMVGGNSDLEVLGNSKSTNISGECPIPRESVRAEGTSNEVAMTSDCGGVPSQDHSCSSTSLGSISSETGGQDCNFFDEGCKGNVIKKAGEVMRNLAENLDRQPNVNCRVESFGRMCANFGNLQRKWVKEMGFSGLLHLNNKQLPRGFCYWLMTRIDPVNQVMYACDGKTFRLSRNQVNWVLGIPKGQFPVPLKATSKAMEVAVQKIRRRYSSECQFKKDNTKVYNCKGIQVTSKMIERAEGMWVEEDETEFKKLFLILALQMVLCPTQGSKLGLDLDVAVCVAPTARQYDWCGLVLHRLMSNVRSFAKRFYVDGYAGGCGGCTIFLVLFYLDRLRRLPLQWGISPRVRVWTMDEIRKACNEDRYSTKGDYGKLGCLDIAYGEHHPLEARDNPAPPSDDEQELLLAFPEEPSTRHKRRGRPFCKSRGVSKRKRLMDEGESSHKYTMESEDTHLAIIPSPYHPIRPS